VQQLLRAIERGSLDDCERRDELERPGLECRNRRRDEPLNALALRRLRHLVHADQLYALPPGSAGR
jgi:hypothetical protein